jgi:DNA repair protein RAD5
MRLLELLILEGQVCILFYLGEVASDFGFRVEVGRIATAAARWIAKLLDKDLVHISGISLNPPTEFKRTGDSFVITLKAYLKASAFRPISTHSKSKARVPEKYLSTTSKKAATIFEGAETAEEQTLRERKASLVALFDEIKLKPKRSGFDDFAKKKKAGKDKGKDDQGADAAAGNGDKAPKKAATSKKGKNTETIGEGEEAEEAELEGEELDRNQ